MTKQLIMREEIAERMFERSNNSHRGGKFLTWKDATPRKREEFLRMAKGAMLAMMTPTEPMTRAMLDVPGCNQISVYREAINAVVDEGE